MKKIGILLVASALFFTFCGRGQGAGKIDEGDQQAIDTLGIEAVDSAKIIIEKAFTYNQYTLQDAYPYKDTVRVFQWDKIRSRLALLESIQKKPVKWAVLQNYKEKNGKAALISNHIKDEYDRISDTFRVERYQAIPLYQLTDTITPERYAKDGALVSYVSDSGSFVRVKTLFFTGEWFVPERYVERLSDTTVFSKAIFVDRTNQNIMTMEKEGEKWLVRSMNPATTGAHHPPYQQPTPLGIFTIQEKRFHMDYLKDGTNQHGGFAPYANRFSGGGYIHGVPVDLPHTQMVEFSSTLGTIPRSHMCVRNATSHAKYIYEWAPVNEAIVFVIE